MYVVCVYIRVVCAYVCTNVLCIHICAQVHVITIPEATIQCCMHIRTFMLQRASCKYFILTWDHVIVIVILDKLSIFMHFKTHMFLFFAYISAQNRHIYVYDIYTYMYINICMHKFYGIKCITYSSKAVFVKTLA